MQNDHKKELQHYETAIWTFPDCVRFLWSTAGPTHINHLYTLYEAVIMVYHTLQMHYSSPILTRLAYIITRGRMHYICMCMYIMAYMCIYTDIHVTDLFMYFAYIHVLIYPYICCIFFCVCVWAGLSVRTQVWGMRWWRSCSWGGVGALSPCPPTPWSFFLFMVKIDVYLINCAQPIPFLKASSRLAHNLQLICRTVPK